MALNYTSIVITNGITAIDLQDGANYSLVAGGWSPKIAKLRTVQLGNQSPYEDVVEELTIDVFDSSPSVTLARIETVFQLINQARQWSLGDDVSPVEIRVDPQGNTFGPWRALILDGEIVMPNNWADKLVTGSVDNVIVRLKRRGIWLRDQYTSNSVGGSAATKRTPVIGSSVPSYSPASVIVTGARWEDATLYTVWKPGYWVLSQTSNNIAILNAETYVNGTNAAVVSNGFAVNGQIARLTGAASIYVPVSGFNTSAKRVAVFASIRNVNALHQMEFRKAFNSTSVAFDRHYFYPDNDLLVPYKDNVTFVGVFDWTPGISHLYLGMPPSFGGETLDIDYFCLVNVSDPGTFIIRLDMPTISGGGLSGTSTYRIINDPLTQLVPKAELEINGQGIIDLIASGNMWISTNNALTLVELALGGNSVTVWQPWNGSSLQTHTVSFTVRSAAVALQ